MVNVFSDCFYIFNIFFYSPVKFEIGYVNVFYVYRKSVQFEIHLRSVNMSKFLVCLCCDKNFSNILFYSY